MEDRLLELRRELDKGRLRLESLDRERQELSDHTCTALQLANHWQDVTVDLEKNRIYLPFELFAKYGYTEDFRGL